MVLLGRVCLPGVVAYSVAKYGAEAFSDGIRRELAPFGIRVSIIEPGFFQTDLTNPQRLEEGWLQLWNSLDKEVQNEYGEKYYQTCKSNIL
jgi:NAD(P)-dependent dehydrogenase (short-subunit alcohol dehydrogenase family)